jgi:FkbM family methyltransferase
MRRLTTPARHMLRRFGIDIERHSRSFDARRGVLLRRFEVACLIDVGANTGDYALGLRREGFKGPIVSVEPVARSYSLLAERTRRDPAWYCVNAALGPHESQAPINVAKNLASSSLLPMCPAHLDAAPQSAYQSTETVRVRRLDDVAREYGLLGRPIGVKLDVQGYELEALAGGEEVLRALALLECEVSFIELYEGQPLMMDVVAFMSERGLRPVALRQGFTNSETGEALQADLLFARLKSRGD